MNRRTLIGLKKKLRDPIWQSIGVLIAFIGLLTPLIVSRFFWSAPEASSNRIVINEQTSKFLTDLSGPGGKEIRYYVGDKEERDLRLFVFTIDYKGVGPVRPGDFYTPLRAHLATSRKIIGVQASSKPDPPMRFDRDKGNLEQETRPPTSFEIETLDSHNFQIKPLLMNPREWFAIEIYTAAANPDSPAPPKDPVERYRLLSSEITWDCHVAGAQCPGELDLKVDYGDPLKEDVPLMLQVSIRHEGWGVYLILVFSVFGLLLMVLLAKSAGLQRTSPVIQIVLFSLAIALSIASAEVASDWLITDRILGVVWDEGQPVYAYIVFWTEVCIILALAAVSIRTRGKRKSRVRRRARRIDDGHDADNV